MSLSMQFWLLGTWGTVHKFKDILGNKLQLTIKRKEVIEKERKRKERKGGGRKSRARKELHGSKGLTRGLRWLSG